MLPINLKYVAIAFGLLVLAIFIYLAMHNWEKANVRAGQAEERAKQVEETIQRVEEAKDVREEATASGDAGDNLRFNQCVRSARTPENCKRFLPQ